MVVAVTGRDAKLSSRRTYESQKSRANQHLRQCLVFLNMPAMQQPEAYIGNASKMFNDSGEIIESSTREFVSKFLKSYSEFLTRFTVEQTQSSATRERSAPEAAP